MLGAAPGKGGELEWTRLGPLSIQLLICGSKLPGQELQSRRGWCLWRVSGGAGYYCVFVNSPWIAEGAGSCCIMHHGTLTPSCCSKQVTFCYLLLSITAERSMWCKVVATKEEEPPLVLLTAEGCQTHTCGRAGIAVWAPEKLASANAMTRGNSSRERSRVYFPRAPAQLSSWEVTDRSHKPAQGRHRFL